MSSGTQSPKRIFSFEEAAALLPEVRRITERAYLEVAALGQSSGDEARARIDEIMVGWARRILEMGIEVKGPWLIDFDSGSGYYCWRYPEAGLQFFHSYEEGFRGRMRIH